MRLNEWTAAAWLLLIAVAGCTILLLTSGCSGEYLCQDYAVIIDEDGYLHLYGSDCEYDYMIPIPGDIL